MSCFDTDRVSNILGIAEEPLILRCRKCRRCVADSTCLSASKELKITCNVWHVDVNTLPEWILTVVNKAQWTVGKLNCQYCGARLGAFNFLNCPKCPCGHDTSVHFSKSRVDEGIKRFVYLSRAGRAGGQAEGLACLGRCLGNQKRLEGLELRGGFNSNPNPNDGLHLVTQTLNSEIDPATMQIQAACFGHDPSVISPESILSLTHTSPTDECINEPVAALELNEEPQNHRSVDTNNEGHRDIETFGYLEDTDSSVTFVPSLETHTLDTVAQHEQEGLEVTEEVLSHATSRTVQLTKRKKNCFKSLRRKQRKRERWLQSQLEDKELCVKNNLMSSDEEKEGYTCAVCLDVYYNPYMCQPCSHVFCEPCLRMLARNRPSNTPCPLCRTLISQVLFQTELHQSIRSNFQKEYLSRKEVFQKNNYSKWPLPNCPKRFHMLWGFHRQGASRRHRAFGLDGLDLGEMQGWPFNSDVMVIIMYSFHWVLALITFCGLCYFFLF
ncbi:E3 ubiquitin-protein ligase RNF180 [Electrophorus electricus]|uniref:RING-type domain-containing protein n=1 Tax=Electrophorus electricus TaxID=8005 RepID=A0A4W4ERV5_ELEEL|nr:E3 ubiquitin-protein ligase RNF180 [Electrophorus electricus]